MPGALKPPMKLTERRNLILLLLAALVVRLPLLVTPGYDVRDYKAWAHIVSDAGIGHAYDLTYPDGVFWFDYGPFYLYVLRATAWAYQLVRPHGDWDDQFLAALLKLTPVLFELGIGVLVYSFVRSRGSWRLALVAAAMFLFNPALIWDTAYWGGIDAFHGLFLTAALFAACGDQPVRAWPLATLAVGVKLTAVPGAVATVPGALRRTRPWRLALAAVASAAVALVLSAPILLQNELGSMVGRLLDNVGSMPVVSANAHNFWWFATLGDGWRRDTGEIVAGLDYRLAGYALFAAVAAWLLTGLWTRASNRLAVPLAGAFLSFAFFMLTTEVHENWGYALFAPLAAVAALRPRYRLVYVGLSVTMLANMMLHDPSLRKFLGHWFDHPAVALGVLNAAAQCFVFGWWASLLVRSEGFPSPPGLGAMAWLARRKKWGAQPRPSGQIHTNIA